MAGGQGNHLLRGFLERRPILLALKRDGVAAGPRQLPVGERLLAWLGQRDEGEAAEPGIRRWPWITIRCTQRRVPLGSTLRNNPPPLSRGSIPGTWVTDQSGDMGDTVKRTTPVSTEPPAAVHVSS